MINERKCDALGVFVRVWLLSVRADKASCHVHISLLPTPTFEILGGEHERL